MSSINNFEYRIENTTLDDIVEELSLTVDII